MSQAVRAWLAASSDDVVACISTRPLLTDDWEVILVSAEMFLEGVTLTALPTSSDAVEALSSVVLSSGDVLTQLE